MPCKKKSFSSKVESIDRTSGISVLDLPDLVLECILEKLPPEELCRMASVCASLRDKCMSDYLWEKHIKDKWARIIGPAAYREWQWHIASRKDSIFFNQGKQKGLLGYLTNLWPVVLIRSSFSSISKKKNSPPADSLMSWYFALESGKFWFPAQVYNRENGHVGFMLSCYDAELSYDLRTDTFHASKPWNIIGAVLRVQFVPPLYCFLKMEGGISFLLGWWYGVVGHLETCDGNANFCRCHDSDTLVLEFNQYTRGSRWRRTTVSRKNHREEGNEADGFYGGIRKLRTNEEISVWKKLWPSEVLE
ncbi:UNVERIFIED_CONTAM: F-box protein [Sesamum angustifolium]|uniref:F-box protein n=1 Tax=Sesamum angustifolium TaxID=2727405 RepID=A0AAW2QSX1_9LAMI